MVQEGVSLDVEHDVGAGAADAQVRHIAPRCLGLAPYGPKRGKVLLPQQALTRLVHQPCIYGLVVVTDTAAEDGRAVVVVVDNITVATGGGAETAVERLHRKSTRLISSHVKISY